NAGDMGFINKKGEWVIEPQYYFADIFNNGYAAARNAKGLFGLIDEKGEWVIEPQYNSIYYGFDCSYFRADIDDDDNYIYINIKNEPLNDKTYHGHVSEARFEEGLCAIYDDETGLLGYMNEDGEYVIPPQFTEAYNFSDGIAAVRKEVDGKEAWGYIDKSGNVVIDYQYQDAGNFSSDGIAVVKDDGKWGYIKTDGSWLLKPQFDKAYSFSNGYATVKLNPGQTIQK
ncbi:WG repeat-containing protein, partial [Pseudobutyrivibrio sp.]|uniref:WG repeat-containing protein n=1 Tax=Pseudobutyrivibrio sp. TaxID=2014367 RepID=UPI00386A569C